MSEHKTVDNLILPELWEGHRRIVWDDEGFVVQGRDVLEDIARQPKDYCEVVEVVNIPPTLAESIKASWERSLGEVAKPKPTGLVGFFGLE